ncbi:hypothetical protein F4861DRAFT_161887 [Xylaria intraflava]|nr:hypothetical protein F4861DRAFT_161887 [Xylaria intraflava]
MTYVSKGQQFRNLVFHLGIGIPNDLRIPAPANEELWRLFTTKQGSPMIRSRRGQRVLCEEPIGCGAVRADTLQYDSIAVQAWLLEFHESGIVILVPCPRRGGRAHATSCRPLGGLDSALSTSCSCRPRIKLHPRVVQCTGISWRRAGREKLSIVEFPQDKQAVLENRRGTSELEPTNGRSGSHSGRRNGQDPRNGAPAAWRRGWVLSGTLRLELCWLF